MLALAYRFYCGDFGDSVFEVAFDADAEGHV